MFNFSSVSENGYADEVRYEKQLGKEGKRG